MSKYLSIGKVAQIRDVNTKSLRYYDQIGVLKPAFTDPTTGYRYYDEQQMVLLDIIQFFIETGIPLKTFNDYFNDDGGFNLEKFLKAGKDIVEDKKKQIDRTLKRIELTLPAIEEMDEHREKKGFYYRQIKSRHLLTLPIHKNPSLMEFESQMTLLRDIASKLNVAPSLSCGIIADINEQQEAQFNIYILIDRAVPDSTYYRLLPEHLFNCKIASNSDIYRYKSICQSYFLTHPSRPMTIIGSSLVAKVHYANNPKIELQILEQA